MKIESDAIEKVRVLFVEAKLLEFFDVLAEAINLRHDWVAGHNDVQEKTPICSEYDGISSIKLKISQTFSRSHGFSKT